MPRNVSQAFLLALSLCLVLSLGRPVAAQSAAPVHVAAPAAAAPAKAAARPALPDYGGRSSSLGSTLDGGGAAAPLNPLAQAGRAFEALVIVLVVVVGGMLLLKRSGLLKGDGSLAAKGGPASWASLLPKLSARGPGMGLSDSEGTTEMLALLGSQTLPHSPGAGLHLISVGGRVLLLGATGQSVTLLTEVAEIAPPPVSENHDRETPEDAIAFADYLERVGVASPGTAGAGATRAIVSAATNRLQSLVSSGRDGTGSV